jgi:hypothetical protein
MTIFIGGDAVTVGKFLLLARKEFQSVEKVTHLSVSCVPCGGTSIKKEWVRPGVHHIRCFGAVMGTHSNL